MGVKYPSPFIEKMANNFFLNNDPLLYQTTYAKQGDQDIDLRRLNDMMEQYKQLQQQTNQQTQYQRDYLGELDNVRKNADVAIEEILNKNDEYMRLNADLTSLIQDELMSSIKWKVNGNKNAVKNIERQIDLINSANKSVEKERKDSLNQLNDYVKNYSNITFEEYKKIKNGLTENESK